MNSSIWVAALLALWSTDCIADPVSPLAQTSPAPGVTEIHNIPYVAGGDPAQVLDLYIPAQAGSKPAPLVVWVHGGGWAAGSKDWCYPSPLVSDGYVVASVEYRFSQKALFPAQIQDCKAAIRWLRGT